MLPTAFSDGNGLRGQFLTSFLVNESVAIDAGGLGLLGDLRAQFAVSDIFVTHSHIDHVATLPLFLDNVVGAPWPAVTIHASEATLNCLHRDLFNNRVWPAFLDMKRDGIPFVRQNTLHPGEPVEASGLRLTPIEVDHAVPTLGFLIEAPRTAVGIPSDTGPTLEFWRQAASMPELRAVFLECSFPDDQPELASKARHLTPRLFASEVAKLGRPTEIVAVHIKPLYYDQVVAELHALGLPGLQIGRPGRVYTF
jgi:ribonuclease BN (tRNA processing enzyme)